MLKLLEDLPVELVGTNVFSYLSMQSIVMLERACGSKESHQSFMEQIPHCTPCELPNNNISTLLTLQWFAKRKCRLLSVDVKLTADNPVFNVTNLMVDNFRLLLDSETTTESLKLLIDNNLGGKVIGIEISGNQNREVIEGISACTRNVEQLTTRYSYNCMDWLTADILSKWKLTRLLLAGVSITLPIRTIILQTCTELTSIKLCSNNIDDAAVIAIAQHCSKLQTLLLRSSNITWTSLLALSERCLPLEELDIDFIPNIPTADIARHSSHALSCIRHLNTDYLIRQDASILLPYLTGLTSVYLNYCSDSYIPLLTQHCHKLTKITVYNKYYSIADILSLCRNNALLQELSCYVQYNITDTILIELIHACPHLHTLWLPYETAITEIGILTISEHCPQLQWLDITHCKQVTEAAVLQLLQRCCKLTRLEVSSSSLSKETWTQLDINTQKRVSRWCLLY